MLGTRRRSTSTGSGPRPLCQQLHRQRRVALVIAATLTSWTPSFAQQGAGLTIHVTDAQGHAIEAALIDVEGESQTGEVETDAQGQAIVKNEAPGGADGRRIVVSAIGYEQRTLTIGPAETAVTIVLDAASVTVDEITVTYKRSRPFSPKTLDVLDIVTDSRSRADPVLAVNDLPSSTNVTGNSKLNFRASRDAINRAYFETIPLYQIRTGASVSDNTTGRSLLSLAAVKEVETYPTDPPAYLAGAAGGALRITAPLTNANAGNISIDNGHAGIVRSLRDNDAPPFKLFADAVDLSLSRLISPSLAQIINHFRSVDAGAVLRQALGREVDVLNLSQVYLDDASFPLAGLQGASTYASRSSRWQSAWQINQGVGQSLVTYSLSYTGHTADERFDRWFSHAKSAFVFGSLAWSTRALDGRLALNVGVDHQTIDQRSDNDSGPNGSIFEPSSITRGQESNVHETTAFLFSTLEIGPRLKLSAGGRKVLASSLDSSIGGQLSLSAVSADGHRKLIVSVGRYEGLEVPTEAYYGPIQRSTSRQVEANYIVSLPRLTLGAGAYSTWETADGVAYDPSGTNRFILNDEVTSLARSTRTSGAELYFTANPTGRLRAGGSFTISTQQVRLQSFRFEGANSFPHVVRAFLKYFGPKLSVDFAVTARAGSVYTATAFPSGSIATTTAQTYGPSNGGRLPEYVSADIGFVKPLTTNRGFAGPIAYLNVNNLTDHDNPAALASSAKGAVPQYRLLPGRRFNFGLVIPL